MKYLRLLAIAIIALWLVPTGANAVWGDAASIADSIGRVQTPLTDDYFNSVSGAEPVGYKMNLIRSIYFSDTLGGTAIASHTTPGPYYQTGRFQFAPAVDASQSDNTYWRSHRPAYFEVWLQIVPIGANSTTTRDTTWIMTGRAFVYDSLTAAVKAIPSDSSNRFIWPGNYNLNGYGIPGCRFEVQKDTVNKVIYPFNVTDGAYISIELTDTASAVSLSHLDNFILKGYLRYWGR